LAAETSQLLKEAGDGGQLVSSVSRRVLALAAVLFAGSLAALPNVFVGPMNNDDVTWAKRSLAPWGFTRPAEPRERWSRETTLQYYYCIDHPAAARLVYGAALRAIGVSEITEEEWNDRESIEHNLARGRYLELGTRTVLRLVNFAFFLGTLALAYLGLEGIVGNKGLSAFGAMALAVEPTMTAGVNGVVTYIGADAVFVWCVVFAWFVWMSVGDRGLLGAAAAGAAGGLATATKINGSFVVIAIAAYYAASGRGWGRVARPLAAGVAAAAVFLALDPVYLSGGLSWMVEAFRDTIARRLDVKETYGGEAMGLSTRIEMSLAMLPQMYFLAPVAGILAAWRREAWFRATFFWATGVIVLHFALLFRHMPRYEAPVRAAFLILFLGAGLRTVQEVLQRRAEAA